MKRSTPSKEALERAQKDAEQRRVEQGLPAEAPEDEEARKLEEERLRRSTRKRKR